MQGQFDNFFNGTGVEIEIKTDEKLCQTKTEDVVVETNSRIVM
jgi:hypothetical protein